MPTAKTGAGFVWDPAVASHVYREDHPLKPKRLIAVKDTLEKLGAWNGVKDNIAQAENVRAALLLVARGEAPLGIVYSTDAAAEPNVKIVGSFPADSYPLVIYPAAETKESRTADAKLFLDHLKGSKARTAFEKQGFTVLAKSSTST